jgi:hypothetical protein
MYFIMNNILRFSGMLSLATGMPDMRMGIISISEVD